MSTKRSFLVVQNGAVGERVKIFHISPLGEEEEKRCHGLGSLEAGTGTEFWVQDVFRVKKTYIEVLTSSTCET